MALFLSACMVSGAAAYTFTFAPENGSRYIQTYTMERIKHIGSTPPQTDTAYSETRMDVEKNGTGWAIHATPLKSRLTRNGKPLNNPISELLSQQTKTYHLDTDGRIYDLTGFETLPYAINEKLPPQVAAKIAGILDPETQKQKGMANWNAKTGALIGRSVSDNDTWQQSVSETLANGKKLTYTLVTRFKPADGCGSDSCLEIEQTYDSHSDADTQEKAALALPNLTQDNAYVSGHVTRIIDPLTLNLYAETIKRTTWMVMTLPNQGRVPVKTVETHTYTYDYLR
ncbi:MAG: hypothetical protein CSA22_06215 [Deltaproteobacteria bacterium]|nr:MAG: hypothetical protein CSA22_06215 [Deltaproteobacteria bacterium]